MENLVDETLNVRKNISYIYYDHFALGPFSPKFTLTLSLPRSQCYSSLLSTGLLVGRGKKVKFRGIFRDKFAEKTADFAGISLEFLRPVSLKNDW